MPVFFWTLKALLSHWRRHPVQFFSVLTGLWLATSLLTGVQALNSQARESYAKASQLIGGEPQKVLVSPNGANFSQDAFVSLRRAGWPVSPALRGRITLKDLPDQRLTLLGIEPVSLPVNTVLAGSPWTPRRSSTSSLHRAAPGFPRKPCKRWVCTKVSSQ
jgi:putative ABC transport system permease protein